MGIKALVFLSQSIRSADVNARYYQVIVCGGKPYYYIAGRGLLGILPLVGSGDDDVGPYIHCL